MDVPEERGDHGHVVRVAQADLRQGAQLGKRSAQLVGHVVRPAPLPLEGLLVARGSTMRFRNRQSLRRVRRLYAERAGRDFICNTVFQADAKTSMNWYLPGREVEELRDQLDHPTNQDSFQRLVDFWRGT